MKVRIFEKS